MSYNISGFKLQKIENLTIKRKDLEKLIEKDINKEYKKLIFREGMWDLDSFCGEGGMSGTYSSNKETCSHCGQSLPETSGPTLIIDDVRMGGEGSGHEFWEFTRKVLEKTMGFLKAVVIWEGGDSIEIIKVTDGKIEREEFE